MGKNNQSVQFSAEFKQDAVSYYHLTGTTLELTAPRRFRPSNTSDQLNADSCPPRKTQGFLDIRPHLRRVRRRQLLCPQYREEL